MIHKKEIRTAALNTCIPNDAIFILVCSTTFVNGNVLRSVNGEINSNVGESEHFDEDCIEFSESFFDRNIVIVTILALSSLF